ncbi:hypothetical protein [Paenibacillus tarimensis]|nr:hypothetical protein [Paenibacillus tarimensis]
MKHAEYHLPIIVIVNWLPLPYLYLIPGSLTTAVSEVQSRP